MYFYLKDLELHKLAFPLGPNKLNLYFSKKKTFPQTGVFQVFCNFVHSTHCFFFQVMRSSFLA